VSHTPDPQVKIAIGVITKGRAEMLSVLLETYANLMRPTVYLFEFIIVENDSEAQLQTEIDAFKAKTDAVVTYAQEGEPGIPFARNAVMQIALDHDADFLIFADDDERVAPDWAVSLIDAMRAQSLDLAGGPLRIEAETAIETPWQGAVLTFLQKKAAKTEAKRRAKTVVGQNHPNEMYTNNWAVNLHFIRRTGLKFDTALRYTGGSDTALSLAARQAGAAIGWVPEAVVYDRIPAHRLTLAYHYKRTRDQSRNGVLLRRRGLWKLPFFVVQRSFEAVLGLVLLPVFGRVCVVMAVNKVAQIDGRLRGSLGQESELYAPK
jgi:succinoglycan biosynthesis protein ExoM